MRVWWNLLMEIQYTGMVLTFEEFPTPVVISENLL